MQNDYPPEPALEVDRKTHFCYTQVILNCTPETYSEQSPSTAPLRVLQPFMDGSLWRYGNH